MALTLVEITGPVRSPSGQAVSSGSLEVSLSQPTSGPEGEAYGGPVTVPINGGTIGAGALRLAPNVGTSLTAMSPSGTHYVARFTVRTPRGRSESWTWLWQITAGPTALLVGDVPRINEATGTVFGVDAATLAARDAAVAAQAAAEAAMATKADVAGDLGGTTASPEVRSTHLATPLPEAQGGTGATNFSTQMASKVTAAGGDASATVVTATGAPAARTAAAIAADVVSVRDVNYRQRARETEAELADVRAVMAALSSQLMACDGPSVVFRAKFPSAAGVGAQGTIYPFEQYPHGTQGEDLTYTRTGNAVNEFIDPDFLYNGAQYTCGANLMPMSPRGALIEPAATQYVLNNTNNPASPQTLTLSTGWHCVWGDGGGDWTALIEAGTATVTGPLPATIREGVLARFKVTVGGTVTLTIGASKPARIFVQTGAYRSSPIVAAGTTYTRGAANLVVPNALVDADVNWCIGVTVELPRAAYASAADQDSGARGLWYLGPGAGSNSAKLMFSANTLVFAVFDAASAIKTATVALNAGLPPGPHTIHASNANGTLSLYIDGQKYAATAGGAGTGVIGTMPATMDVGRSISGQELNGFLYEVCVAKSAEPTLCPLRVPLSSGTTDRSQISAGNTVVVLGDSITASTDKNGSDRAYWSWASALTDHRFRLVGMAGVGGNTSTQIRGRLATVIKKRPAFCVILAGANDFTSGVTSTVANIQAMAQACLDNGITPVVSTVTPSDSYDATMGANRNAANVQIAAWARATPGVIFADMGNSTNGTPDYHPATGMTSDGVHPAALGAYTMGKVLAAAMLPYAPRVDSEFATQNDDPINLLSYLSDPFMCLTGGTATAGGGSITGDVPWGFELKANGGTLVTSFVDRTDGRRGRWFQVVASAAPSSNDFELVAVATTGIRPGGLYYAQIEFEADPGWTTVKRFDLACEARSPGDTVYGTISDLKQESASDAHPDVADTGILRTGVMLSPVYNGSNATKLAARIRWNVAAGTLRIGRVEIRRADRWYAP